MYSLLVFLLLVQNPYAYYLPNNPSTRAFYFSYWIEPAPAHIHVASTIKQKEGLGVDVKIKKLHPCRKVTGDGLSISVAIVAPTDRGLIGLGETTWMECHSPRSVKLNLSNSLNPFTICPPRSLWCNNSTRNKTNIYNADFTRVSVVLSTWRRRAVTLRKPANFIGNKMSSSTDICFRSSDEQIEI